LASELPGGQRRRRPAVDRTRVRTADEYYKSGDVSAVQGGNTAADSTLKPGQAPVPAAARRKPASDRSRVRSADEYYKAQDQAPTAEQIRAGQVRDPRRLGPPPQLGAPQALPAKQPRLPKPGRQRPELLITQADEINGVMQEVVSRLSMGEQRVIVYVAKGQVPLLRRARTNLELLVTREVITEDQARDVTFSYEQGEEAKKAIDAKLGAAPTFESQPTVSVDAKKAADTEIDPLAFLNGEGDDPDDPKIDVSPVAEQDQVEVDTSNDPDAKPDVDDDDGADNTFLNPENKEAAAFSIPFNKLPENLIIDPNKPGVMGVDPAAPEGDRTVVEVQQPEETVVQVTSGNLQPMQQMEGAGDKGEDVPNLGSHIEAPTEAMEGVGDAPKPQQQYRRGGRRSGRGS